MENYWRESAAFEHHSIPVRMTIEITISIIRMVPPIITSVPVIRARIFTIHPD